MNEPASDWGGGEAVKCFVAYYVVYVPHIVLLSSLHIQGRHNLFNSRILERVQIMQVTPEQLVNEIVKKYNE